MTERRTPYTSTLPAGLDFEPEPMRHEPWYVTYQQCRSLIDGLPDDSGDRLRVLWLLAQDAGLRVWVPG